MGKNQQYKAMQRAKLGASSTGQDEIEDGMVDGSFHSPEWHAARLASLKTSHTVTWEEYKKKQKEDELRKGELEADKDKMMREYRAQLDAERAMKLAKGRNHSSSRSHSRKDKDKDVKKRSSRKRKHSRRSSDSSSSDSSSESWSESSSSEEEDRKSRKSRSSSSRSRSKKEKKHRSRSSKSSKNDEKESGPLPLSRFFGSLKSS